MIIHGKTGDGQDVLNAIDGSGRLHFRCEVLCGVKIAVSVLIDFSSSCKVMELIANIMSSLYVSSWLCLIPSVL